MSRTDGSPGINGGSREGAASRVGLVGRGLVKSYGGVQALDIASLEIPARSITGLIGPNGAGKSTLINVLSGFEKADSGAWSLGDLRLTDRPPHVIARLGAVRTFQTARPLRELSVLQNVLLASPANPGERLAGALRARSWRRYERASLARAHEFLALCHLSKHADSPAGQLSGGQAKLLEIARGLMAGAKLLLLDEPLAGVSPAAIDVVLEAITGLPQAGVDACFVEHNIAAVRAICDHVICMDGGRIIAEGTPDVVTGSKLVQDAYLGREGGPSPRSVQGAPPRKRGVVGKCLVEVADLVAGYVPGSPILQGVTIRVNAGEVVAVLGPNGAGKSTLTKSVLGLVRPTSGSIHLDGRDVTGRDTADIVKLGVGVVPQLRNIFPRLSVAENLVIGCRLRGTQAASRLDDILQMFPSLRARRDLVAGDLSGGQRQLVAMARAMMNNPRLLILDEPSAGLSPIAQREIFGHIRDVVAAGVGILVVEQNARLCLHYSDYGYILDDGRNAVEGLAAGLIRDPKVVDLYLGKTK